MNCTKCGKEIPEGENEMCQECKQNLVEEIVNENTQDFNANNDVNTDENKNKEEGKKVKINKEIFEKMKLKQNKKVLLIALLVIAVLLILINLLPKNTVGNTIGNIRNYGYAAKSGNWIYFLSPNEDSTQLGIFKIKEGDSEQKTKEQLVMNSWDILSLNVSDNYVYFIGIMPYAYSEEDAIDNKIYKMKKDGSDLQVINDNEFDNDCYEIYVVGKNIYYIGTDYNIYKMDLNGRHREIVLNNETGYLGVTDKYIIYNLENEDGTDYVTYIADLDGKNERPVIENTRLYSVNIAHDYIYYADESKHICKVKVDGTDQTKLYESTAYNMNVSGDYIYYLNYLDEENEDYTVCVYRVKADGSSVEPETVKQLDTYSSFLDVMEDWIIYMDSNDSEGFINLLNADTKEEIKVYSLDYASLSEQDESTEEVPVTTP